ncbi:hypothetical protein ACIQU6_42815 [Streptomyces sp. NPDC090442]|uniref:hypothetical protein n=1 Tax=Streptomyces sp. NPDC090442 TaxID=3365962 RepID=UPI003802115B
MPADIFAALGALVRAEAARNAARPEPRTPTPTTSPGEVRPTPPHPAATPVPANQDDPSAPVPTSPVPAPTQAVWRPRSRRTRKRRLLWVLRALRAFTATVRGRRHADSTERRIIEGHPAPDS